MPTINPIAGGGGAAPITRATYDIPSTSIASNVSVNVPLAFNYGTALLDLTTPAAPTPAVSGTYSFAVMVAHPDDALLASRFILGVTLDDDDFGAFLQASTALANNSLVKSVAVTLPFYVPAGSPCFITVAQNASSAVNITGKVQLQRLS